MDWPKFCPECGAEFVTILKIPNYVDPDDLLRYSEEELKEDRNVCTQCGYEESALDFTAWFEALDREKWREINNAIPDVTLPRKIEVKQSVRIMGHHPFPEGYIYIYNPFLLAEISASKR